MSEPITRHLIDSVLYLLISDSEFLGSIRGLIPPEFFGSTWGERLARICYDYYENFNKAPREHFQDEFARMLQSVGEDDHEMVIEFANRITSIETPNISYIMSRLNDFIKSRELEMCAIDVAKLVQKGNYSEAERRMYKALRSGIDKRNIGLDYTRDESPMSRRLELSTPLTSTGWKLLDKRIGGLQRGRLLVVLGKYKGKKTWTLCNIAKQSLMRGLTVVHITHEMPEVEIEVRYDQVFGALHNPKDGETEDKEFELLTWNKDSKKFDRSHHVCGSVYNRRAVEEVRRSIKRFGGRLIIKKYPMGTCNMLEVDRYLKYLEQFEGVVPDVLLNDYADIMAPIDGKKSLRDQLNETYIYHKRLADERNMLVCTASQATRESIEKKKFSMKDFAEDIRKVANADLSIGVCQTPAQEELGVGRAVVVFARNSSIVGAETVFGMNLDIGMLVGWEAYPKDYDED